ncbi:TIGR04211 family SH3 domain-containing protein [Halomonas sp. 18H]|uniref:TIGR04211 family SH3 domain-containing protein n=1 Tax=Halomonas almeriensis TaxID=308163 RepID=UPI0022313034|nr:MULTISPECIES: TIGR04211 family SH3 domain-containing protein [Halomonas]MCW4149364.1 TIGR04211 family SH3 domain-containing protein [Halomonas sp. 18H]MDN3553690.1 TIGR04211 family SH3 domain-containing protein [Halomonas almeriensis]
MTKQQRRITLLGLLIGALAQPVQAQQAENDEGEAERWVTDELTTYVRSGSTDEYRIVGRLTAGDPVTMLSVEGDYTEVRSQSGDVVWIPSDRLQDTPSAHVQLPRLEEQASELRSRLVEVTDTWEGRVQALNETLEVRETRIAELEDRNQQLASEADASREKARELEARLNTRENDLLMRYLMYGGGIAGGGLLVGLIVPHLPRRRRKRDRWF